MENRTGTRIIPWNRVQEQVQYLGNMVQNKTNKRRIVRKREQYHAKTQTRNQKRTRRTVHVSLGIEPGGIVFHSQNNNIVLYFFGVLQAMWEF